MNTFNLQVGTLLVLRLKCPVRYHLQGTAGESRLEGEAVLRVAEISPEKISVSIVRLGLYGQGFGGAGRVSLRGTGAGSLTGQDLDLSFDAQITYDALEWAQIQVVREKYQSHAVRERDHFRPKRESLAGHLRVRLEGSGDSKEWVHRVTTLSFLPRQQTLGLLGKIEHSENVEPGVTRRFDLGEDLVGACSLDSQTLGRSIPVRAIFFKASEADEPRGRILWPKMRDAARRIWRKCCIDIVEILPPHEMVDPSVNCKDDPFCVAYSYFGPSGIIHVFFVDREIDGGGYTYGDGSAHARCVISDRINVNGNINVLAHEFGHVLRSEERRVGKECRSR